MNRKYIVNVRNLAENKAREVVVDSSDAMHAHKSVYMKSKRDEEISAITDEKGKIVGQLEGGLWYRHGDVKPYTGVVAGHYKNGQMESRRHYENGAQVGMETHWYDTGQKRWEMNYQDGQMVSIRQWDVDGNEQRQ